MNYVEETPHPKKTFMSNDTGLIFSVSVRDRNVGWLGSEEARAIMKLPGHFYHLVTFDSTSPRYE